MKLAISSNVFTKFSVPDSIRLAREIGYDGIELLCDVPHLNPMHWASGLWSMVSGQLSRRRMKVSNLNVNTSSALNFGDPFLPSLVSNKGWQLKMDYICNSIRIAQELGAENISIASGTVRGSLTMLARRIRDLCKVDRKFKIGMEFEPGHIIGNVTQTARLLKLVDMPNFGVNLDIGHVVCAGDDIEKALHTFRGKIWNMHIEDIKARFHHHLIPGHGDIDFRALFAASRGMRYDRFLTVEIYPYADSAWRAAKQSLKFLSRI